MSYFLTPILSITAPFSCLAGQKNIEFQTQICYNNQTRIRLHIAYLVKTHCLLLPTVFNVFFLYLEQSM